MSNFQLGMFVLLWEFGRSADMWHTFSPDTLNIGDNKEKQGK